MYSGLEPFFDLFERGVTDSDIERLLEIPIRRISQYDIDKNREDLKKIEAGLRAVKKKLNNLTETTISWLEYLLDTYGEQFPRRTEIASFETVDVRAVARQNIKLSYDPNTGFFGSEVKGSKFQITVSEYDKILIITRDGIFRIVAPDEKMLISGRILYLDIFDQDAGKSFTVVYRNTDRIAYAKKIHIRAFTRDREYELIKDRAGHVDMLLSGDADDTIHVDFVPAKRQRVHSAEFDLTGLSTVGATTRGSRISPKPVNRIKKVKKVVQSAEEATIQPTETPEPATQPKTPPEEPEVAPEAQTGNAIPDQRSLFDDD